jgi:predicted RNase H-like nuclease
MAAVLGIDAAWTEHNPSGFALVETEGAGWRLRAAAPNLQAFAEACGQRYIEGQGANLALSCVESALGGRLPDLIAVDMPLSRKPIVARRASDIGVSRRFGAQNCSTHSPSTDRPGKVSHRLHEDCKAMGYNLITSTSAQHARSLAEVYPHPALLRLMKADERVRYMVSKTKIYWRNETSQMRLSLVKETLSAITLALDAVIHGAGHELHRQFSLGSIIGFSALKPFEDMLDAIICAWVGTTILENDAEPIGDEDSAIWIPKETWTKFH